MSRPWIQTGQGFAIDLLDPIPESICLADLAKALANLNRYTGHVGAYTVAQHSVIVANALRDEGYSAGVQAAGLMHDAHEAIVGDVSSPLKRAMRIELASGLIREGVIDGAADSAEVWTKALDLAARLDPFHALEVRAWRAVASRFRLPAELPKAVKVADLRALVTEARDLFTSPPRPWGINVEPYDLEVRRWTAERAFHEFMAAAARLGVV